MARERGAGAERPAGLSRIATLRPELPSNPETWREAALVGLAVTVALGIATALQVPSFAAPLFPLLALQHTTACTWRNLVRRAAVVIVAGLVVVPVAGVLVQAEWLLVPAFFGFFVVLTYCIPMARSPIEATLVAFPLVIACFYGTFDPRSIPSETRDIVCASLIGLVVATCFAYLSPRIRPRRRLAESLAASYAHLRARLATTMRLYLAERWTPVPGETPVESSLGSHVQLLDLARQEGLRPSTESVLVTLVAAAERMATHVGTIDTCARRDVGRTYRAMLRDELAALAAAIDEALAGFEATATRLASGDEPAPPPARTWPDLPARVAALEARQTELRRARVVLELDVTQGLDANAVVQALVGLADVLHTPPWEIARFAAAGRLDRPPGWPWSLLPLDRFALRFAIQVALGATIALVVGIASHNLELATLLWNPVLVAQSSYGATLRRAGLRLLGVLVGGALAIATIAGVFANTNDFAVWLLALFLAVSACQEGVLRRPTYWYGPLQVAVTYLVVLIGDGPGIGVGPALWRVFGTFTGTAILFLVFRLIAPDYAGRQLVARLADLLRATLVCLPRRGTPLPPRGDLLATRLAAGRFAADLLRLVDEARLEGRESGVDAREAVQAVGLATRVALRAGVLAYGRATVQRPALDPAGEEKLERLREAVRSRVAAALAVLDARHTMARPRSREHRRARAAAARECARPRADVAGPLADVLAHVEAVRTGSLLEWPPAALDALFAELEHGRRLAELLPRFDAALERTILPEAARDEPATARAAPLVPSVSRP